MDISAVLDKYLKTEDSNIIITDENGELLYNSSRMDFPTDIVMSKLGNVHEDYDEQEFFDRERNINFIARRTVIEDDGKRFVCYRIIDQSEYSMLVKEVATYSKSISNMSKFQIGIMNRLSHSYNTFLPSLADYCIAEKAIMFINKDGRMIQSTYSKERKDYIQVQYGISEELEPYSSMRRGEKKDTYTCVLNSSIFGQDCVVLVKNAVVNNIINPMDVSVHNVIRLFIENSILRDRIVYESEHDRLTGLYNKGKYMSLKNAKFGEPSSIAILNFDVNNLKHINDNYGHECGDALIIKAAKSLNAVLSENVNGFRMGGDEFLLIATNISEKQAEELRDRWKAELIKLNENDKNLFCAMACGVAYGSGEYDYDELYADADMNMYIDKKHLKERHICSDIVDLV